MVGLMVLAVPVVAAPRAAAQSADDVAAEIMRVQDQADRLSEAWAKARDRVDDLNDRLAVARRQLGDATSRYASIDDALTKLAIARFTGQAPMPMVMFASDPEADMQREALAGAAAEVGAVNLDEADALKSDLQRKQVRVNRLLADSVKEATTLRAATTSVERQLERLDALQARLQEAEIRRAYEAKLAEQRAAQARREAAAEQTPTESTEPVATPRGGGKTRPRPEPTTTTTEPRPAPGSTRPGRTTTTTEATRPPRPGSTTSSSRPPTTSTSTPDDPTPTTRPRPTAPETTRPRPTVPETTRPPQTTVPKPDPPPPPRNGILCPVRGPSTFSDWWHAPRSGGRVHLGLDMLSRTGTPVVAVVGGHVTMKMMTLGGLTASLVGNDGNRYFYGHFSAWEGGARKVSAGDVIGYVGSTGQTNTPHLHFEYHPGGGPAVNPYSMVKQACR